MPLLYAGIPGSSVLLPENGRWSGVGQLRVSSACTATFIVPRAGVPAEAPAYILSAGHCYSSSLGSSEIVVDRSLTSGSVSFRYFVDTPVERRVTARVRRVVWASMRGTDLAVFELDTTVGALRDRGIEPLVVGERVGEELEVVGIPVSGVPVEDQFLRRAGCRWEGVANLVEFVWTFRGFLREECADVRGGSSGSPVVNRGTGEIVSVMSTTVEGESPCYLGSPCVVGGARPEMVTGNYSAPVVGLDACFAGTGQLVVGRTGCPLDARVPPVLSGVPPRVIRTGRNWNVTVNGRYRYGVIAESAGFCGDVVYGAWREAGERIEDAIPGVEGGWYLCVEGEGGGWAMRHVRVDQTPPGLAPRYWLEDEGDRFVLRFEFSPAELSSYSYQFGPEADCGDLGRYQVYRRVPVRFSGVGRVCLYGEDEAGNRTPVVELGYGGGVRVHAVVNAAGFRNAWLAPGAYASVFGTGLAGAEVTVVDWVGERHRAKVLAALPGQVNFLVPEGVRLGMGRLEVGGVGVGVEVRSASPGLFWTGTEGLEQWGTGLRYRPDVEGYVGGLRVGVNVETAGEGLERVRWELPEGLVLRGLVPIWVKVGEWESNRMWVRLR